MEKILSFAGMVPWWGWILLVLLLVAIRDIFFNRHHTISHNYPIVGHFRYMIEAIGPELRQYIVANNREELPFNRSQRSWIYASAKQENNYQGFGTDQDIHSPGYLFVNPAMLPYKPDATHIHSKDKNFLPCAKVFGAYNKRKRPFRPRSIVNISAMSYGSLSKNAIQALNEGSYMAGCYHNTGEGGLSPYHANGADVVFHFGTGYFGVRGADGNFSMEKMVELVNKYPFVRAIEVKLSQGAKPGKGGVLPAKKITKEISEIRGVPMNQDVLSPSSHTAFKDVPGLVDFVESIAEATGLPVGIKSAVGKMELWTQLAEIMLATGRGPDFITIDGGEGGTGAAPPAFADHVSLPFVYAFTEVYKIFKEKKITNRLAFVASGKLGFPADSLMAFAMGADCINIAREAMISIGCIQAQICHTNNCPSGVATQKKWLQAGLDTKLKAARYYNYNKTLRKEILEITHACGYEHPCEVHMGDMRVGMGDNNTTKDLESAYGYQKVSVGFNGMESLVNCPHLGGVKAPGT